MERQEKSGEERAGMKNKGGRPKKTRPYYNRKVTIYLSNGEYEL